MPLELKKASPVTLRSVGLNEKWLHAQIVADPTLLGLGGLEIMNHEYRQPSGGRLDFLMLDRDADTFYEVEIMLGTLDESHIIRTIEYWDIERQRRPDYEHRAVIVAEEITSRFFNVLRLFNRSVPMIAVQLSAFRFEGSIVLHAITVLDVAEESGEIEIEGRVDRDYWEKRADPGALAVVDKIVSLLQADSAELRVAYNRYHIAVGTSGRNFCWCYPSKRFCRVRLRFNAEARDEFLSSLEEAGIDASPRKMDRIVFRATLKSIDEHQQLIRNALKQAEEASRA